MLTSVKKKLGMQYVALTNSRAGRRLRDWAEYHVVSKREHPDVRYHETATGKYYLPSDVLGDSVVNAMIDGKVFEQEVVDTALSYITPGSVVLDVGANFGQMSVLFSRAVGQSGAVHSFEANGYICSLLQKNLSANDCSNVTVHRGAVYDVGSSELTYPDPDFVEFKSYGSYGLDPTASTGRRVATLTIDSLRLPGSISFMKVDIQGSDLFALRGAAETICRHRMPIIFEYEQELQSRFATTFQDYVDFVARISYRFERTVAGTNFLIVPK